MCYHYDFIIILFNNTRTRHSHAHNRAHTPTVGRVHSQKHTHTNETNKSEQFVDFNGMREFVLCSTVRSDRSPPPPLGLWRNIFTGRVNTSCKRSARILKGVKRRASVGLCSANNCDRTGIVKCTTLCFWSKTCGTWTQTMSSGEKRRQTNQRYIVATELFGLYFFFLYTNYTPKTSHSVSIKMNMDVLCISVRNGIFKIKCRWDCRFF